MTTSQNTYSNRLPTYALLLLLLGYVLIGVSVYDDYGVVTDEPAMTELGKQALAYLTGDGVWPVTNELRFHGPLVEICLRLLVVTMGLDPYPGAMILLRHGSLFALSGLGLLAVYGLALRLLGQWPLAWLGTLWLIASPRIFAHAFYNARDIPFMVLFAGAMYTLVRLVETRRVWWLIAHATMCALALSVRSTGVLLPAFTVFFLLLVPQRTEANPVPERLLLCGLYLCLYLCLAVLVWPLLWEAPLGNFLAALAYAGGRFGGGGWYFGMPITENPWHYIPVWITLTTPLLYTGCFVLGTFSHLHALFNRPWSLRHHWRRLVPLVWCFGPTVFIAVMGIGLFNGWRHLYFVYPAFILIALEGVRWLYARMQRLSPVWHKSALIGVCTIIGVRVLSTGVWMVRNHPLQAVYFSLPATYVDGQFDLDYWAMSSRPALEYIAEREQRSLVFIHANRRIAGINAAAFFAKPVFVGVPVETADYIIDVFQPDHSQRLYQHYEQLHAIMVGGVAVAAIYKGPGYGKQHVLQLQ